MGLYMHPTHTCLFRFPSNMVLCDCGAQHERSAHSCADRLLRCLCSTVAQGEWVCPTCVYEGHAPAPSPLKQRRARARPTAPDIVLEGLTMEELAEAAADPLLGKAQRKAARAQLREEKRRMREEKVRMQTNLAVCPAEAIGPWIE